MDRTRVEEIIAAYGADATRWPPAEREAAQALAAGDDGLGARLAAAAALDAELTAWAMAPVEVDDVAATAAADAALAAAPAPRRWWPAVAGGSVAASLLALALVLPMSPTGAPSPGAQLAGTSTTTPAQTAPVQTAEVEQDVQLWASVFTLTPEEESLI